MRQIHPNSAAVARAIASDFLTKDALGEDITDSVLTENISCTPDFVKEITSGITISAHRGHINPAFLAILLERDACVKILTQTKYPYLQYIFTAIDELKDPAGLIEPIVKNEALKQAILGNSSWARHAQSLLEASSSPESETLHSELQTLRTAHHK